MNPQIVLVLIILAAAAVTTLLAHSALLVAGRLSLRWAVLIPPVAAVLAVVLAVVTATAMMFLSGHDAGVAIATCTGGGLVAIVIGTGLARRVHEVEAEATRAAAENVRQEEAEATRRELIAGISHDLRTPLAGLRAMAEALEDGVAEDPARFLGQIRAEVEHLNGMVTDLFEVSRLNAGVLQMCPERIALADLIDEAVALAEPLARQRGVRMLVSSYESLPVQADARAMTRAVGNLLVNAIRHTPHDATVQVMAGRSRNGMGVVSVADRCGGIPPADLPHIFDLGWQGDAARTPGTGAGSGLGLSIVRGIIEAHGGLVSVRNLDHGCRFDVRVPLAVTSRPATAKP
jgi:signal transduction histidine kinase